MTSFLKKIIPKPIFEFFQPYYHYALAVLARLWYQNPSQHIKILGITGTKGKSSTVEFANSILEAAGHKTAILSTIRFKLNSKSTPNLYKMSLPGRFFVQKFLREAVKEKCDWAILEITSEGMKQYRHIGIELDCAAFLNIAPEHIESHGSFEKYLEAKLRLGKLLEKSPKERRTMIVNADDPHGVRFMKLEVEEVIPFKMKDAEPWETTETGIDFTFDGVRILSPLRGEFNIANALAAATFAKSQGIPANTIKIGIENVKRIPGRVEFVKASPSQDFYVVIDYAHTAESLEALYKAFPNQKKICVLGNTGGGRDTWKRPVMAQMAEKYCDEIILTNEDPYDEDPRAIIDVMKQAITKKPTEIIMDRREAIREAIKKSKKGDVVLITGKGTDPYIMEAEGKKTPWSDSKVAKEELEKNFL